MLGRGTPLLLAFRKIHEKYKAYKTAVWKFEIDYYKKYFIFLIQQQKQHGWLLEFQPARMQKGKRINRRRL